MTTASPVASTPKKSKSARAKLPTTLIVTLIPVCVALNIVGGYIASALRLPVYLDMIGTAISAIVLDGNLYSAPTVHDEIDSDSAQITGSFTDREAINLANVVNNPLDLPLVVRELKVVGPSLAQDAIDSGVRASVIGTALVAAFTNSIIAAIAVLKARRSMS